MPHPDITRRPRPAAIVGAVGALLLVAGPAGAVLGTLGDATAQVCDAASGTVASLDAVLAPTCDAADQVVGAAAEALAPVTEAVPVDAVLAPVEEALAPIGEAAPAPVGDVLGGGDPDGGQEAPADGGAPAPAAGDGAEPAQGEGQVAAAGKDPVEVTEPQGPAAQGRVTGPTIQPTVPGANIAGIASQSGLTLQPYEAMPMVSIPTVLDQPMVAGAPVTTSSPVAAVAAGALDFAGDVVLPQTSGQAFLLTAVGLGLVTATGTTLRRRFGGTTTLDVEI